MWTHLVFKGAKRTPSSQGPALLYQVPFSRHAHLAELAHAHHLSLLLPLLAFFKEWLYLVLGLALNTVHEPHDPTVGSQLCLHASDLENRKYGASPHGGTMIGAERCS